MRSNDSVVKSCQTQDFVVFSFLKPASERRKSKNKNCLFANLANAETEKLALP